ncbi:MAG: ABC transporter permease subunit [Mangrovibacterium sp.]
MNQIARITKRELQAFFDSLMGYIMIVAFLGFSGFFTWLYGGDIFYVNQASLQTFFNMAFWTLFFFIPALTMKAIAEEKRSGTLEFLLTKPVSGWQIVWGKFFGVIILIGIALLLTLPYYLTVWSLGPVDHGAVWSGYLALLLMSGAYTSIGIFASSLTNNQIVAFLLSLLIGICFHLIFGMLASGMPGLAGEVLQNLSLPAHFESVARGVIDSKDLIYFLSVIFLGMVAAETALIKRT